MSQSDVAAVRAQPLDIEWSADGARIGRISIGGEYWAAVEWSEKRRAWCIEDAEGACLTHKESIHGQAPSKEAAVELAREMILDGRMPSPHQAREAHNRRKKELRLKRRQQPAELRRDAERRQRDEASTRAQRAESAASYAEEAEQPLWAVLHETFDFADPELWRSNSFASLRPRLIIYLEAAIAKLDAQRVWEINRRATSSRRCSVGEFERQQTAARDLKLARAREILKFLRP